MKESPIQWTDATVNFSIGCRKVSQECSFCYMWRFEERYGRNPTNIRKTGKATFYSALKWKEPKRIFTCSMSDFFMEEIDDFRDDAWDIIRKTPHHTWLILTKRPERIMDHLPPDWDEGWSNVWLGTTVGVNSSFKRAEILANVPSKIRFISAEPLLEELDFQIEKEGKRLLDSFHWIILGGESGNDTGKYRYRPSELPWYYKAVEDLRKFPHISIFVKQLGTHLSKQLGFKKDRHGGNMDLFPKNLQIREFPNN